MIQLRNVTKTYGDTVIFENTNYCFPPQGIVCLMGASGGGKTTLLNLLAGFDTNYTGEILIADTAINQMTPDQLCNYRREHIGFIFQNYHLLPGYTVLENVCIAGVLSDFSSEAVTHKAIELLTQLGIEEKKHQRVENLSGGQKQRTAIARALLCNPQIVFADEPTGALDRTTSTEIMNLLKVVAKDRLVVVITHDAKICEFADEVIHIKENQIFSENGHYLAAIYNSTSMTISKAPKISVLRHAVKNFKVHANRYLAVSLAISIGLLAFLFSLSFGNVMEHSINEFKEKNTAFNNGYIKGIDDGTILDYLLSDERIENVYYQYKLENITLTLDTNTHQLDEKFPMPKATESLSYGVMPQRGKNEIALSPSLAKKFTNNIQELLGKTLILELNTQKYQLSISGIYNAAYDDFFVSSDVEQQFYTNIDKQENYSISYDVKNFSDIVALSNQLELNGINAKTSSDEVSTLQNTFDSLNKLFLVISILILAIALFICAILLIKLQNTRYRELGLLSALGFNKTQISSMIRFENLLLSFSATTVNLILLVISIVIGQIFGVALIFDSVQILLSIVAAFGAVILISTAASYNLIRTEPAEALRK